MEHLFLEDKIANTSSEFNHETDRTRWRQFLASFSNVKNLRISGPHEPRNLIIRELGRALQPGEGESPMELLPRLQELSYLDMSFFPDAFTLFVDARKKAGHPVTIIYRYERRVLV